MTESLPKIIEDKIKALHRDREDIYKMTAEEKLDAILDHRESTALVHSFPEQDLYFLVHEIGAEDALPILGMAKDAQWDFILDQEIWKNDRIDMNQADKWLFLLHKSDPDRLTRWFMEEISGDYSLGDRLQFIEYYLNANIVTMIRAHDQDPSELGEEMVTFDDIFYVHIRDRAEDVLSEEVLSTIAESEGVEYEPSYMAEEDRKEFIFELLSRFAGYDHVKYQKILLESSSIIPAEALEDMYHHRGVRLAEKGFIPFEESVAVYAPLTIKDVLNGKKKVIPQKDRTTKLGAMVRIPQYPAKEMAREGHFTYALEKLSLSDAFYEIQHEFVALLNNVVTADKKQVREKDDLNNAVRKVCGYLGIGLEAMADAKGTPVAKDDYAHAASWLLAHPLKDLFRMGFGRALKLKWKADKWRKASWFQKNGLPLGFWDETWMGVLGGLFLEKPLYFDDYETGELYREFQHLEDIKNTAARLEAVMFLDALLSAMDMRLPEKWDGFLTYKKTLLTPFAKSVISDKPAESGEEKATFLETISLFELKAFLNLFFGRNEANLQEAEPDHTGLNEAPAEVDPLMKEKFITWLSEKSGADVYQISQKLGNELEDLFSEIEIDYGYVGPGDLDPRFVHCFLMGLI